MGCVLREILSMGGGFVFGVSLVCVSQAASTVPCYRLELDAERACVVEVCCRGSCVGRTQLLLVFFGFLS